MLQRIGWFLMGMVCFVGCSISREHRHIAVGFPAISPPPQSQGEDASEIQHDVAALHDCDDRGTCVERGEPRLVIDGVGWVLGVPRRILLWDRRVDNHSVSADTVSKVVEYLETEEIDGVVVRVNQYAPISEWKRLRQNDRMHPGWKYTFGLGEWIGYTLFPGRIWGGDHYNPYTNTLSLYSDVPSLGVVEGAYAKDVQQQDYPGLYASSQTLPLVAMWHETKATNETISYVALRGTRAEQAETRKLLFARYGMELGGEIGALQQTNGLVIGNVYQVIGALGGHAYAAFETP